MTNKSLYRGIGVLFLGFLLVWLVLGVAPQPARANPGVLYAAPTAQGAEDCSSWDNACTLQTALTNASDGDEIWVKAGVHYPGTARTDTFALKNGVALYGGFAGTETSRAQRNSQINKTILSGDIDQNDNHGGDYINEDDSQIVGDNAYHVVTASNVNNTAILDGFIITAGQANGADANSKGGGVYNEYSSPTLNNLIISGNMAAGDGGGMYNSNSSSPTLTNITITGNAASGGGGMFNDSNAPTLTNVTFNKNTASLDGGGVYNRNSTFTLSDVTFDNNAAGGSGGGIYNYEGRLLLTRVAFTSNSAALGGGLRDIGSSNSTLLDVTFNGNVAADTGGGMWNYSLASELKNVAFLQNTAANYGGGMYTVNSNPTLVNVLFVSNSAAGGLGRGGGMANAYGGSPTLTNAVFRANTAYIGGGMHNEGSSNPTLTNVTFYGNSASYQGGGLAIYGGSPILTNVILWGDSAPTGAEIFNNGGNPTVSYSDIQGGYSGEGNINADPRFVDAANGNLRLQPISPAIDAGNNAAVPPGVTADLDGNPRIMDGNHDGTPTVDMGAYESYGILFAAPTAQGNGDCLSWENACTLQTALTNAVSGDEIWVMKGVHYPGTARADTFALKSGVALYGGFAGTEIRRDQRDWEENPTILSGDIDKNDIDTDGNFIAETPGDIQGNNAYHVVTASGTDSTAILDGFIITAGQANSLAYPDYYGGGMIVEGGSPTLRNLRFEGNFASSLGGGMYNGNAAAPTLADITFQSNRAGLGGGGMANKENSVPTLEDVSFIGNEVENPSVLVPGGGMYNDSSSPVLERVIFRNNIASGVGGGMFNLGSSPSLTNVLFFANSASSGGGMYNQDNSTPSLVNVTFHRNQASNQGGGMYNASSNPELRNVILWGNIASQGWDEIRNVNTSVPTVTYSDIEGGYSGEGNINADPLFVDGENGDLHLGEGSPAIDAGNNDAVPPGVATDLDGNPRIQDGNRDGNAIVDMGAYEAPPDTHNPTVVSITVADLNPTNATSVRFTVTFSEPVTGVDTGDFSLTVTGLSGASIDSVSAGPAITYTVTVSTGSGEGTLRLDVPADATIVDLATNSLIALPYQSGETYTIDRTSPQVNSITRLDANPTNAITVRYRVEFSEPVAGVSVSDFRLYATGSVEEEEVLAVSGADEVYTVTVATGVGSGMLRLDIPDTAVIADKASNPLSGLPFTNGEAYTVNKLAPALLMPANGAVLPNRRPMLDWGNFPSASSYQLQIALNASFTLGVVSKTVVPSQYEWPTDLAPNKKYYWHVRAQVGATYTPWSETWSFTTGNPPSVPILAAPANNALVGTTPTFDWANVTLPAGTTFDKYEIQIATNAAFQDPLIAYTSGIAASQYTPAVPLERGTKYYWRVRAWNTVGEYSAWSAVRTVRVKYAAPVLQSPVEGASNLQPEFAWDAVAGATGYTLQVSKNSAFTLLVINKVVTGTVYAHSANLPAGTYWWRVWANGAFGPGEAAGRSFTAGAALPVPVLVTPASNALVGAKPVFDWADVTVPLGMTFDKYEIQIATNAAFQDPLIVYPTESQYTPAVPLERGTKYYWRVRAWNGAGVSSAWSAVRTVRVKYAAPGNAQVAVTDKKPTFLWDAIPGATSYTLQVSPYPDFRAMLINCTQSGTSHLYTFALPSGTYYWRVQANGDLGPGEWFTGSFVIP